LLENLARRHPGSLELMREIGALKDRGYTNTDIAAEIDFTPDYIAAISYLLEPLWADWACSRLVFSSRGADQHRQICSSARLALARRRILSRNSRLQRTELRPHHQHSQRWQHRDRHCALSLERRTALARVPFIE
jgi:hypothetical protein